MILAPIPAKLVLAEEVVWVNCLQATAIAMLVTGVEISSDWKAVHSLSCPQTSIMLMESHELHTVYNKSSSGTSLKTYTIIQIQVKESPSAADKHLASL